MARRGIDKGESAVISQSHSSFGIVRLRLKKNLKLKYKGPITGKEYYFDGGGSEVDVDERDAVLMLEKRSGVPCCTGTLPTPYFEIVR